ncbi:MAG: Gfo/Idh/MocA family oxidoreductase [Anaerolineales bacterium]|nr:Gfo/Idh/MocA family oxidoreductase [Anaerolineales bacterium]
MKNFAVIGVGGYIAPRHLRAIKDTGNCIVAATDPKDSVGVLDQYSYDIKFFSEIERFDRHLEKLRRGPEADHVHYVSVCSPNYLHDAHCRLALRVGADAICEKPLVINPWNLDALEEIEAETKRRVFTVLQLRVHPSLMQLRESLQTSTATHDVELTYITSRGPWYQVSWKGDPEKSGGVATNIGIHFFDLLMWLFGSVNGVRVYHSDHERMSGFIELERARVRWVDGREIEFSEGFTDLHTKVYEETLAGRGFGIADARPSVQLTHDIRKAEISPVDALAHPLLKK